MGWRQATWINLLFDTSLTCVHDRNKDDAQETVTEVNFSAFIIQNLIIECLLLILGYSA